MSVITRCDKCGIDLPTYKSGFFCQKPIPYYYYNLVDGEHTVFHLCRKCKINLFLWLDVKK